ncbi:hypothetical protein PFISCL1PPCAC_12112, partial [Pristionchus fissidentatus]
TGFDNDDEVQKAPFLSEEEDLRSIHHCIRNVSISNSFGKAEIHSCHCVGVLLKSKKCHIIDSSSFIRLPRFARNFARYSNGSYRHQG